jgi:hypothetical protein
LSYTKAEALELMKGEDCQKFRGSAMYMGLVAANMMSKNNVTELNEDLINASSNVFFGQIEQAGIKEIPAAVRKEFAKYFRYAWDEWQAGRGRDLI